MKLIDRYTGTEINVENKPGYGNAIYAYLIDEFIANELTWAFVKDYGTKTPYACVRSIKRAIEKLGYSKQILVLTTRGEIVLIRD